MLTQFLGEYLAYRKQIELIRLLYKFYLCIQSQRPSWTYLFSYVTLFRCEFGNIKGDDTVLTERLGALLLSRPLLSVTIEERTHHFSQLQ